jgi:hypothetical protein
VKQVLVQSFVWHVQYGSADSVLELHNLADVSNYTDLPIETIDTAEVRVVDLNNALTDCLTEGEQLHVVESDIWIVLFGFDLKVVDSD